MMLLRRNYCAVFFALFACWFSTSHADELDWTPNHHLVEVDDCHKINLDQNTGIIVFTAICKPEGEDWFFKIWASGKPAYVIDQKLAERKGPSDQLSDNYEFSELSKTRKVFKFTKSVDLMPQMVFRDMELTSRLIDRIKSKKPLNLLIATTDQYISLNFSNNSITKSDFRWHIIKDGFSSFDTKTKKSEVILELLTGQPEPIIPFARCSPDAEALQIDYIKLAQNVREKTEPAETCTLDIISGQKTLEAFPIIGRPSNSELELEQLIWEIILEANRLAKHPTTDIKIKKSQKYRRPEIKHFIHSRLIPLILDKKPATDIAFKLYSHIFSKSDGFKYSLALHLNCSSFQKSMIEKGQALVQTLTSELSKIEFAKGRILYAISRDDFFKGVGYADGVYGLIGQFSDSDQCVNTTTLYSNFLRNSSSVEAGLNRLIANFELVQITQKMIASSNVSLNYPDANSDDNDPIINLIDAYKYFLYAVQLAQDGKYLQALETFDKYLTQKYTSNGSKGDVMPGDRDKYLKLLALSNQSNSVKPNIDIERLVEFAIDQFIPEKDPSGEPRKYLDEFAAREGSIDVIDATIDLLGSFSENSSARETSFLLLQRRFMDPETIALTRRFRPSPNQNISVHLARLLIDREPQVNQFYEQLSLLESISGSKRDVIRAMHEQAQKKFPEYFWKQGTTEQLLTRNNLVVNSTAGQSDEMTPMMVLMSTADSWEILDQIWQQKTKRAEQIDQTNSADTKIDSYDPVIAIGAYANMVKLDNQIRDLNPKISDLTTAKAMGISDVSLSLKPGQALMMVSISDTMKKMSIFAITSEENQAQIFEKKNIESCLKELQDYARGKKSMTPECAESLSRTFNPKILLPESHIKEVILVLNGIAKDIPFAAIPIEFSAELLKGQERPKPNPKYRGLKVTENRQTENRISVKRHLIENFMISHYPFVGMLAVKNMLAHSGSAAITERKFVGLSITEMPRKSTNIVELDFILESLPDLKATKEEIEEVGNEFSDNNRVILNNKNATAKKLIEATKNNRPFLMSFATHAVNSNEWKTEQSSLVIYGDTGETISLLDPNTIAGIGIGADNVFLSACETYSSNAASVGLGNTLVSSFLLNGSRSVLTSTIPVEDNATRKLMSLIAKDIVPDKFPKLSRSFQKSVKKLLQSEYAHPRFWSGFRVMGE